MSLAPVRIHLQARSTLLEFGDAEAVTLPVGPRDLAEDVLRHEPPTPAELERAIDVVEDALTGSRLARSDRGDLVTADALLRALPGLDAPGTRRTRDAVETLFQRLASRSLGTPVAAAELPVGRDFAAALVILRECMHHLGFDDVAMAED
jgi:exopolyphosphatase/pppGpp-phosphohydrolase